MARVNVTLTNVPGIGTEGKELTLVTGDAGNDHKLLNRLGSRVLLIIENGPVDVEVTIHGVDAGDDIVDTVPANKTYTFGPFSAKTYTQNSGDDKYYIQVDLDDASNVKLAAVAF